MRIDAHQHFWAYSAQEYRWIDGKMRALRRDFLPEDLVPVLGPFEFDGTIAVQARQSLEESRWLLGLARGSSLVKGVVGWAPLAAPNAAEELDALAQDPLFKGVRHIVQDEPDPAFLEGRAFNEGVRKVTARGLVYDLLIGASQLPSAIAFVDRHPSQAFVLDHAAKPPVRGAPDPHWRRLIRDLAQRENVCCKFSGLATETEDLNWTPELLRPYFDEILEAFEPRRLLYGSDWPVCLVATSYGRWLGFAESCAAALSDGEKARILGGTAAEIYRLQ